MSPPNTTVWDGSSLHIKHALTHVCVKRDTIKHNLLVKKCFAISEVKLKGCKYNLHNRYPKIIWTKTDLHRISSRSKYLQE